ncbi:LLM class flavin-dependent oxidoreductase [Sphingobium aquiterrae]|uniref:LLM class flavin-dependent oxidoreductase n=1 Tax=Sphingobium aquiterrae TaxID=2038656 RepID=UPI0030177B2C
MTEHKNIRLGVLLHGTASAASIAPLAASVEAAGFDEFWVSEDYFMLAGFSSAAIALAATQKLRIGLGAVASVARHPAATAMEAATLATAFPGRFDLAIGHGASVWMRQMGVLPKSPLTSMRECVTGIKALLAGKTLDTEGQYFTFGAISLTHKAPEQKVLTAVVGPKSIDLTGEIGDGLVISVLAGPRYVAAARARLTEAANAVGRSEALTLPTYVLAALDEDAATARAAIKPMLAFYLAIMGPTDLTGCYGINDQLADMIARGGADVIEREMPDEWLEWLGVWGTPDHCVAQIRALHEAGATSVVLVLVAHDNEAISAQIDLCARSILPALAK